MSLNKGKSFFKPPKNKTLIPPKKGHKGILSPYNIKNSLGR